MADQKLEKGSGQQEVNEVSEGQMSTFTAAEERRLLQKIDCVILPMICFVFFFQYLDKQSLSYASVFGLIEDLHLTQSEYSWCSSIFYFGLHFLSTDFGILSPTHIVYLYTGQLVSEYPFMYLMSRLPLAKFVGATIILWGGVCMCLAAPKNFAGFAAVRFLLGFTEGAVSPAFVTITSIWYRKKEHPLRVGAWVTMNGLAQVVGSLLMYGVGKNSSLALAPWRVLFLITGALTSACGIAFYIFMPSGPDDAWFLGERDKQVLIERMALDREGGDKTSFSFPQLMEALLDVRAWFVFTFGILTTMNSPVLTFASLIIKNLHYDKFQTMLFTAPSGAVQIGFIWIGIVGCFLLPKNRSLVILLLCIPPLVGNCLLLKLPLSAGWGMIVASWLASCISDIMAILLSLFASNVKGNTKRAIVNTFYFIGYCVGCIGGPQLWKSNTAPRFFQGVETAIITWCLLILAVCLYWLLCAFENKRRDKLEVTGSVRVYEKGQDVTDKEDLLFRYSC